MAVVVVVVKVVSVVQQRHLGRVAGLGLGRRDAGPGLRFIFFRLSFKIPNRCSLN